MTLNPIEKSTWTGCKQTICQRKFYKKLCCLLLLIKKGQLNNVLAFQTYQNLSKTQIFLWLLVRLWVEKEDSFSFPFIYVLKFVLACIWFILLCSLSVYSKVDQLYMYIYLLIFSFFSHVDHYRVLRRVPWLYSSHLFYM